MHGPETNTAGTRDCITLRHDAWKDASGGFRALLVIASGVMAEVLLVARSGDDGAWTVGKGLGDARLLDADRDAFEPALHMHTLLPEFPEALGIFGIPNLWPLVREIADAAVRLRGDREDGPSPVGEPPSTKGRPRSATVAQAYRYGYKVRYNPQAYRALPPTHIENLDAASVPAATERRRTFAVLREDAPPRPAGGEGTDHAPYAHEQVAPFLAPWHRAFSAALTSPRMDFAGLLPWSSHMHAFVSAPDPVGTYRRQALSLYPFLGPVMAAEPDILALIDAGRPFEASLVPVMDRWAAVPNAPGYSLAKLRRLRGIRMDHLSLNNLGDLVRGAARLAPSDIGLLETRLGRARISGIEEWVRHLELDAETVFGDVPRSLLRDLSAPLPVRGITDMVERCGDTLALACLLRSFDRSAMPDLDLVAARLLLEGMTLSQCLALERRWHAGLGPFEGRLPVPREEATWPALFEPYRNGIVEISCLVRTGALRAEGSEALDDEGEPGLSHCIGGYGPRCYTGELHVASVRIRDGDRSRRISTVAFTLGEDGVRVSEHSGRANAPPPPEAVAAVESLLADVAAGLVTVNPDAREKRGSVGYRDGIDWHLPESLEACLAAWRPFLPAWAVDASPAEVSDRVAALMPGRT